VAAGVVAAGVVAAGVVAAGLEQPKRTPLISTKIIAKVKKSNLFISFCSFM